MKESEIRPQELFERYLTLAEEDVEAYFSKCSYHKRTCPACGQEGKFEFHKKGFDYHLCSACLTLFVNPLPEEKAFTAYYKESQSTKFWATDFYKHTEEARREKIVVPRVETVAKVISKHNSKIKNVIDIGGGYGTFAQEMKKKTAYGIYVIEPNKDLGEVLNAKGVKSIPKFLEQVSSADLPAGNSCFTSFELVEHLTDPRRFFSHLFDIMKDGDLVYFTTLSGLGLDIQVLWEKSNAIHPPHHVNFFNPRSIRILLEDVGFTLLDVQTPGKLDVDILNNNRQDVKDRFWKNFIEASDEQLREKMQEVIQKNGLSSHMAIIAQKKVPK